MASPATRPLRVLISGGGIAGPALAFWLNRLGHACTIVERFPSLRANGQQIDIRRQGVEAAERMGILDDIRALSVDEAGMRFVDASGKNIAFFPKLEMKPGEEKGDQGFSSEFEIMRGDLCRLLYEKTTTTSSRSNNNNTTTTTTTTGSTGDPNSSGTAVAATTTTTTEYRFGTYVTDFQNEPDSVRVGLSDGSSARYDLLVAADGQGSRIRKMLLEDEPASVDSSRDFGLHIALFTIPRRKDDAGLATIYPTDGRRIIFTRFHSATHGQCYFATMARPDEVRQMLKQQQQPDGTTNNVRQQKDFFADMFRGCGWQADRLVDDMLASDDFYVQPCIQIRSGIWSKGRVTCLGDAGYGPTALTGMGTSLALIGAHVLAGEISQAVDVPAALARYEAVFRPYVQDVQQIPRALPGIVYPESRWGVRVMQLVLRITSLLRLERLFQTSFQHKDAWQIPQYPKLKAVSAGFR
ncbi:FAD dependent oxidoreductase [Moelleriella libera RCEF 2490]|uniref:FAD dependent oxidoreductase n=1 Tax=Moelleriella libera RCEF 2490 TaxID=1081109 RepID=A0A162IN34_9HYPO|nr:FAD dependent oxidoreductase [Moelleriella libera RCEF 2490]